MGERETHVFALLCRATKKMVGRSFTPKFQYKYSLVSPSINSTAALSLRPRADAKLTA
jgi:hypothetical protein